MTLVNAPAQLLIDGKLAEAVRGDRFDIVNPATEQVIGSAPDADATDMSTAIEAARRAFDESSWSTDLAFRLRCVRQLHQALVEHGTAMRALTTAEAGAPAALTLGPQYDVPVASLDWTIGLAENYAWTSDLGEAQPMGIP